MSDKLQELNDRFDRILTNLCKNKEKVKNKRFFIQRRIGSIVIKVENNV